MNATAPADPAAFPSGHERRAWRRARRDHDAQQLTTLRALAATGGALTSLHYRDLGGHAAPGRIHHRRPADPGRTRAPARAARLDAGHRRHPSDPAARG